MDESFGVYYAGEQVPGTEIGLGYIRVTTPLGDLRMTEDEAEDLGQKLICAARLYADDNP
ncbi:MAG: hypothetical protein ACTHON_18250 [Humibacter sp.]